MRPAVGQQVRCIVLLLVELLVHALLLLQRGHAVELVEALVGGERGAVLLLQHGGRQLLLLRLARAHLLQVLLGGRQCGDLLLLQLLRIAQLLLR